MTIAHVAYLFDWRSFEQEVQSLVQAADAGDSEPVIARASAIITRIRAQKQPWILEDPWNNPLSNVHEWARPFAPEQLGYSFLVVLSTYLHESPASLLGAWSLLHAAVTALGWSERDATLLTTGWYTEVLLRPTSVADPLERPLLRSDISRDLRTHDFAWWVRPGYGDAGWLDTATAYQLRERLLPLRDHIAQMEPRQLYRHTYPTVGPNTAMLHLLPGYDRALTMLTAAAEADRGLFFVIS